MGRRPGDVPGVGVGGGWVDGVVQRGVRGDASTPRRRFAEDLRVVARLLDPAWSRVERLRSRGAGVVGALCFVPTPHGAAAGAVLAAATRRGVVLFDTSDPRAAAPLATWPCEGVGLLAASPDEGIVAAGGGHDSRAITLWSARSGHRLAELTADEACGPGPADVAFARGGAVAVACTDGVSVFGAGDTRVPVASVVRRRRRRRAGHGHGAADGIGGALEAAEAGEIVSVDFADPLDPTVLLVGTSHDVRLCDLRAGGKCAAVVASAGAPQVAQGAGRTATGGGAVGWGGGASGSPHARCVSLPLDQVTRARIECFVDMPDAGDDAVSFCRPPPLPPVFSRATRVFQPPFPPFRRGGPSGAGCGMSLGAPTLMRAAGTMAVPCDGPEGWRGVKLWSVATGAGVATLEPPDGDAQGEGDGDAIPPAHFAGARPVAACGGRALLAATSGGTLALYSCDPTAARGDDTYAWARPALAESVRVTGGRVVDVAVSPDGGSAAAVLDDLGGLRLLTQRSSEDGDAAVWSL